MPAEPPTLPSFKTFIVNTRGSRRVKYSDEVKVSEVFDKSFAPSKSSICVLIDVRDDDQPEPHIYGLAVAGSRAGVGAGAVRVTLMPILKLAYTYPLEDLAGEGIELGKAPEPFYARSLSRKTLRKLLDHLKGQGNDVEPWLRRVTGVRRPLPAGIEQARTEAKDAVHLASQFAGMKLPQDAFQPSGSDDDYLLDTVLNAAYTRDLEEELLPLDMTRFDGKLVPEARAASMTVFADSDHKRRLVVMSVNKKPLEEELGIDLLYWDQIHDSFTFVQYKRLEREAASSGAPAPEWIYTREGELKKQLKLMPAGAEAVKSLADWRAFDSPFWFKFVRGDAGAKLDDKTLRGMYVPAGWLRLAVEEGVLKTGKRGGFRVTYGNTKYLGRDAFTQLVSRGLIGTGGSRSRAFKKVIENLGADRELIIAVRTEWSRDTEEVAPVSAE